MLAYNIENNKVSNGPFSSTFSRGEKDWKLELAAVVCKRAGIQSALCCSIRDVIQNYILQNGVARKINVEALPIPKLKVQSLRDAISDVLPVYLVKEVETRLKSLVEVLKIYNEDTEETSLLIDDIIEDLMKNPVGFEAYSCYFSSSDEKNLQSYLETDPTYRSYLEMTRLSLGRTLKRKTTQFFEESSKLMRNPMKQKHLALLRFKSLFDRLVGHICIPVEDRSYSNALAELAENAKKRIETVIFSNKISKFNIFMLELTHLESLSRILNDYFDEFLGESQFSNIDKNGCLKWKLLEVKLKLRPKLLKEGIYQVKNALQNALLSKICTSTLLEEIDESELSDLVIQAVAQNKFENNGKDLSKENSEFIHSKIKELQSFFELKVALETEYFKSLASKRKNTYYLKIADVATDAIGVSKLTLKAEIYSFLAKSTEKPNIKLKDDESINLPRHRLIELGDILNNILNSKGPSAQEINFFYLRNKAKSCILEKLSTYFEEINDQTKIENPETEKKIFETKNRIAETLIGYKDRNIESFRGEFTNRDYADFSHFLSNNKIYEKYLSVLKVTSHKGLMGKIDPFDKEKVLGQLNTESEEEIAQSTPILSTTQIKKRELCSESLNDSLSMPECSEKYLLRLLSAVELHQLRDYKITDFNFEKEFECFKELVRKEQLAISFPDIELITARSWKCIQAQKWEDAKKEFHQILRRLQILDFSLIIRLVKESEESAEITEDKNVLMFLGGTGSGKSTTIHFLSGSQLTLIEELDHLEVTANPKYESLKKIKTNPSSVSETRFVTSVSIDPSEMLSSDNNGIVLCDTPGFDDTRSPEIDIANAAGLVIAMRKCKSVKPVIVLSFKSLGDRLQGLREIIHTLARLSNKNIDEEDTLDFSQYSYIFTKFEEKDSKALPVLLEDLMKISEQEKADQNFLKCLKDMLTKTKKKKEAYILNPLIDQREQVLRRLIQGEFILNPHEEFQVSLANKSKKLLTDQLDLCKKSISTATQQQRYSYVEYKLDQLRNLWRQINLEIVKETYESCLDYLSRYFHEEFERTTKTFGKCFYSQNELLTEDITAFKSSLDKFDTAQPLLSQHLKSKMKIEPESYLSYVETQVDSLVKELNSEQLQSSTHSTFKRIFHKLDLISSHFPEKKEVQNKYDEASEWMLTQLQLLEKSIEDKVKRFEFDESLVRLFSDLEEARASLTSYLKKQTFQTENIKLFFLKKIEEQISTSDSIFQKERISEKDVEQLSILMKKLQYLADLPGIQNCLDSKELSTKIRSFTSRICDFYGSRNSRANELLKNNQEEAFGMLEEEIREMSWICKSYELIDGRIYDSYINTLGTAAQFIWACSNRIVSNLSDKKSIDYTKLVEDINFLAKSKWLDEYHKGNMSAASIQKAKKQIDDHLNDQKNLLLTTALDPKNYSKISILWEKICELKKLKSLENIIPGVQNFIEESVNCFYKKVEASLNEIRETINDQKEARFEGAIASDMEDAYNFLDCCCNLDEDFIEKARKLFKDLKDHLKEYGKQRENRIHEFYDSIIYARGSKLETKEQTNAEDLKRLSQELSACLQELENFKEDCVKAFLCFPDKIISKFQKKISRDWDELQDDFRDFIQSNYNQAALANLLLMKTLSIFERYLEEKSPPKVYQKQREFFEVHIMQTDHNFRNAVKNHEFSDAGTLLDSLNGCSNDYSQKCLKEAKTFLNRFITDFFSNAHEEINFLPIGRDFDLDKFKKAAITLKNVQKIQESFQDYIIDIKTQNAENLQKDLNLRILECLNRVESLKLSGMFPEFENMMELVTFAVERLGRNCSEKTRARLEDLQDRESFLRGLLDKYEGMNIGKYGLEEMSPKELLEKLAQANKINPDYQGYLTLIKEAIWKNCRDSIQNIEEKAGGRSQEGALERCERALYFVPESMRYNLEFELRNQRKKIKL